jgi:hypothetical protein
MRYVLSGLFACLVLGALCLIVGAWVDDDDDIRSIQEDEDE